MVGAMSATDNPTKPEIHAVLQNATLRYSQVWEDYELLIQGLQPKSHDHVVSIGSAGDNALALLASGVETVTAVDLNPAQVALCELKKLAISKLEYVDFTKLLGHRSNGEALRIFRTLCGELSERSAAYWESHTDILERGILHSGRLEMFWNSMRQEVFERHLSREALQRLVSCSGLDEQREVYEKYFTGDAFCGAFRDFTDKKNVAKYGRDAAQYKYVQRNDIGEFFLQRFRHVCSEILVADNFYMHYLFFGTYASFERGPFYLRPDVFERIQARIKHFEIAEESLDTFVSRGEKPYSKMNLSDLFEYLSPEETDRFLSRLVENMVVGGRIAFWNHLNPRGPGPTLKLKTRELRELGERLFRDDRTFFYSDFKVLEVL